MMAEKRLTFTNEHNERRGHSQGSGQFNNNNTGNRNQTRRSPKNVNQQTDDAVTQFSPRNN